MISRSYELATELCIKKMETLMKIMWWICF